MSPTRWVFHFLTRYSITSFLPRVIFLKDRKCGPKNSVPSSSEPNHAARLLFLRLLNGEWPALQKSLLTVVLPSYRDCWDTAPDTQWPKCDRVRKDGFEAPLIIRHWSGLSRSRRHKDLRNALLRWAAQGGHLLRSEWMLESALATLDQYFPANETAVDSETLARAQDVGDKNLEVFGREALPWRYGHQTYGAKWGAAFEPKFAGTIAHPEEPARWLPEHEWYFGTMEQFRRRMRNQFERELSKYCKEIAKHWSLNKSGHVNYARWTIARLSGLTWSEVIARFPELERYTEPETQVKKRVREFLSELDPTLSSTMTKD